MYCVTNMNLLSSINLLLYSYDVKGSLCLILNLEYLTTCSTTTVKFQNYVHVISCLILRGS